jgi:hypothetical protein
MYRERINGEPRENFSNDKLWKRWIGWQDMQELLDIMQIDRKLS